MYLKVLVDFVHQNSVTSIDKKFMILILYNSNYSACFLSYKWNVFHVFNPFNPMVSLDKERYTL